MGCGIYQIVNCKNGHVYVGSSSNLDRRFIEHKSRLRKNNHVNSYLQNAWNLYGEDSFEFDVLITCHPDMLLYYEQQFIDKGNPEYNLCPTAGNTLGRKLSDSECRRRSKALLGNKRCLGYKHTDEARHNMGKSHKGILAGEKSPMSKLTDQQVIEIRNMYKTSKVFQYELAAIYGISQSTVSAIVCYKAWKHLQPTEVID